MRIWILGLFGILVSVGGLGVAGVGSAIVVVGVLWMFLLMFLAPLDLACLPRPRLLVPRCALVVLSRPFGACYGPLPPQESLQPRVLRSWLLPCSSSAQGFVVGVFDARHYR